MKAPRRLWKISAGACALSHQPGQTASRSVRHEDIEGDIE
jgi:hypothetical protein